MKKRDGTDRSAQDGQDRNIRNIEDRSGSVGTFSPFSSEHGYDQVRASGENSAQGNILTDKDSTYGIYGKIASQLITETEKQLAYHEEQVKVLKDRIKELRDFSPDINETD